MSRLLLRRKSSVKSIPIVKTPLENIGTEFRWSVSVAQLNLLKEECSSSIDLDNSQEKSFLSSSSSTARNSTTSRSSFSTQKLSPRLPNRNKKTEQQSTSIDHNNTEQIKPLLLTYSQLYHAQHCSLPSKKISRVHPSTTEKYIRLHTPQLRRLHVSEKYIKEAKTLYFNASSKVFVPLLSIARVS